MQLTDKFDQYRNDEMKIDVSGMYKDLYTPLSTSRGLNYLDNMTQLHPIMSRQVAAMAIANAVELDRDQ